jgi:hypothetical protein
LLPNGQGFEIAPFLRRNVRIAHHNLAYADAQSVVPEAAAVFCRNVLMYFDRNESEASVQRIAERIPPGGHLFLGHSDSPGRMSRHFEPVQVAGVLCYRRLSPAAPPNEPKVGRRLGEVAPGPDLSGLLAEGDLAAATGDLREARRAFGAAGLAMMRGDRSEDLSGLGGYTRRDLARAIASKLTENES